MDAEFIHDLFAQFRAVTVRRMFSGAGLFCDGVMFGLVVRGVIYLKADETSIADFEREGSEPFTYVRGKTSGHPSRHALRYWRLPERLYDDHRRARAVGRPCARPSAAQKICPAPAAGWEAARESRRPQMSGNSDRTPQFRPTRRRQFDGTEMPPDAKAVSS